jgi:WD40 repeat protein
MTPAHWFCAAMLQLPSAVAPQSQPPITALAFAPDNLHIVRGSQAGVTVHRGADTRPLRNLEVDLPQIHDVAFAPNGQSLAVAGGRPSEYGEVVHLQWPSGRLLWRRVLHDDVVYRVAWQAQGELLATAAGDHRVVCVAADTGELRQELLGHSRPVLAVTFLPDGRHLISAGVDRSLRVWDVTPTTTWRILDQHTDQVRDVACRRDDGGSPMIASVSADRTLRFWQPTLGRLVRFAKLPAAPLSVTWLNDRQHVAVGCEDGHLRVIHHQTLKVVSDRAVLEGWVYEVAAADGPAAMIAAAGSNGRCVLIRQEDWTTPRP